jgi:hypothetical protein
MYEHLSGVEQVTSEARINFRPLDKRVAFAQHAVRIKLVHVATTGKNDQSGFLKGIPLCDAQVLALLEKTVSPLWPHILKMDPVKAAIQ